MRKTIRQINDQILVLEALKAKYEKEAQTCRQVGMRGDTYTDNATSVQGEINTLNWVLGKNG
jgi:hypothetical protein